MGDGLEELLIEMSWRESNEDLVNAENALNNFILQADRFIKSLCYSQSKGDDVVFKDYYKLFILDIWENCYQYDDKRNTDDEPSMRVKKWLSYRVKGVIRDYWSKRTASKFGIIGNQAFEEPFEEESYFDDVDISDEKLKLSLDKVLKPIEIDILQTHYNFRGYVPKEISEALCKEYKISESYRRVIKSRALKKLKEIASKKSLSLKEAKYDK